MYAHIIQLVGYVMAPLTLAGGVVVAGFLLSRLVLHRRPLWRAACQLVTFAALSVLLVRAGVVPFLPTPVMALTATYLAISCFKIIWWLTAAWLCAGSVRALLIFKRQPMEARFFQDLLAGFIYVGAVLGIVAYVFDTPVSGLLAASGVIAIVLGLALQSTLGDVFSGVVLNLSKPYQPGDWIILDGGLQGRVQETNWRATYVLTLERDLAIIPNSLISKGRLVNASKPSQAHGLFVTIRLDPTVAPLTAVSVLETAMLSCNHILRVPAASVAVKLLDATAIELELTFFVAAVESGPVAQNEVFDRIFRHCASAGIRIAPPACSAVSLPLRAAPPDPADIPRRLLDRLPIFATLSAEERTALAPELHRHSYKPGDVLLEQGIVAGALFVLHAGVLAALQKHGGQEVEVFRLAPGDCFGQSSVLTGQTTRFKVVALTKASVYEIDKIAMAPILKARPAIAAELAQMMARRDAAGKARLAELHSADPHPETLADRLASRMRVVFGLG